MVLAEKLRRPKAIAAVLLLVVASAAPLFANDSAQAYGLLSQRKITMSDSTAQATDVTYEVSFNTATNGTDIQGVVVDFCSNSPIIGETCTAPAGFDTNESNLALNSTGVTGFSLDAATTANKIVLTRASGTGITANTNVVITLGTGAANDGITNPDAANTTFYARILIFNTQAGATSYTSAVPGSEPPLVDAGGIALSTAAQITVTSKVQEKLTFCVYTSAANYADCTGVSGTAVTLGDENGVLDTTGPYVDKTTKYNIATNASVDAAIRIKGETLQTGSFDIEEIGATAASSNPGSEQFGFCTYTDAGSADAATLIPDAPYSNANCNTTTQTAGLTGGTGGVGSAQFAFDNNNTDGTTSTYGDLFATKSAGDFSTGIIALMGNIANTTEAGIYTTTLTFIATGTY